MNNDIMKLREMCQIKKKELETDTINNKIDLDKIDAVEKFLLHNNCFLKVDINVAYGILSFLDVKDEEKLDFYKNLISYDNYGYGKKNR